MHYGNAMDNAMKSIKHHALQIDVRLALAVQPPAEVLPRRLLDQLLQRFARNELDLLRVEQHIALEPRLLLLLLLLLLLGRILLGIDQKPARAAALVTLSALARRRRRSTIHRRQHNHARNLTAAQLRHIGNRELGTIDLQRQIAIKHLIRRTRLILPGHIDRRQNGRVLLNVAIRHVALIVRIKPHHLQINVLPLRHRHDRWLIFLRLLDSALLSLLCNFVPIALVPLVLHVFLVMNFSASLSPFGFTTDSTLLDPASCEPPPALKKLARCSGGRFSSAVSPILSTLMSAFSRMPEERSCSRKSSGTSAGSSNSAFCFFCSTAASSAGERVVVVDGAAVVVVVR
uniref:Uncharacterized protein n=1 Tax=Anopheles melas TaxID=34690 RepID=A0A182TGZ9_9DIPT